MSGTKQGGKLASQRNKERHGIDYYKRIGSLGGKASTTGGFAQGEAGKARARVYGAIGGTISKRKPAVKPEWME